MNNILLTREALNPIYHEAVKAFKLAVERGEEIEEDFAPFVNEYCCRAQVRKVVEWWTSPCLEHDIPKCVVGPVMDRMDCTVCLAALKAAGGE